MKLELTRPIIFFDLESTGLDVSKDRIVEISYIKVYPDGREVSVTQRINPEMPIPKSSSDIHHITDDDVKDMPTFREYAPKVREAFRDADLAGYNSSRFDLPMLAEELLRAGIDDIDLARCRMIDVQTIFHKMEPRNLSAAYRFYCNEELVGAHGAEADTSATYAVLRAQLEKYPSLKNDVTFLSRFTTQNRFADFAGRVVYDDKDREVINFGKYKGQLVEEVLAKDSGYYGWIMNADFPLATKRVFTAVRLRSFGKK